MGLRSLLQPLLLLLLLLELSKGEATEPVCEEGRAWSDDLGKCKDCSLCETSSKDDFCQKCDGTGTAANFPWLIVGCASGVAFLVLTVILSLTIYMTRFRRKNKFTTPIEETGAHSAEALLIH